MESSSRTQNKSNESGTRFNDSRSKTGHVSRGFYPKRQGKYARRWIRVVSLTRKFLYFEFWKLSKDNVSRILGFEEHRGDSKTLDGGRVGRSE